MEEEFIYWKHHTPVGICVEEVSGYGRNEKVWLEIARQIYCEHGETDYREICHFDSGAPYLASATARISISHSRFMFAVASLPRTPEADLSKFSPRTALGIDVEKADRTQVVKVRDKFLSDDEKLLVEKEDVATNVLAWTCKESLFKAALCPDLDWRYGARIIRFPVVDGHTGKAELHFPDGTIEMMELYSYCSEGYIITIAFSPKTPSHKKG